MLRYQRAGAWSALAVCAMLAGCAAPAPVCTAPASHAMLVAELFFGRAIAPADRATLGDAVTDSQWRAFARDVLTPTFPDGMTTLQGEGQWRNPATGLIGHEPSTVVIVAAPDTDQTRRGLDAVMAQYRTQFHQKSVGLILQRDCATF